MLDKNDIQVLPEMFREHNHTNNSILKREIRDEMHSVTRSEIFASETRITEKLMKAINVMKEEIIDGITDVLDNSVLPRLDEHDREIRSIKHHLKLV